MCCIYFVTLNLGKKLHWFIFQNFTCPHCSNGFIEELDNETSPDDVIDITDLDEEPYQVNLWV